MTKLRLKPEIGQSIIEDYLVTTINCFYAEKSALTAHKLFSESILKKEYGPVVYLNFNDSSFHLEFSRKATKAEIKQDEILREQEDNQYHKNRIENLKIFATELGFLLTPLK